MPPARQGHVNMSSGFLARAVREPRHVGVLYAGDGMGCGRRAGA